MSAKVSALATKAEYAIVTRDIIAEMFDQKMLTASLLTHSKDKKEAFAAYLVLRTLTTIRNDLEGRIS